MAEQSVGIDLKTKPDEAWAVVGDFEGVGQWFPGIETCRLEGDTRVLGMMGMEVREQLVERDEEHRAITYRIVGGVPVESHRATVSVTPRDGGSHVEWAVAVEPETMVPVMLDVYQKALEAVRDRIG